MNSILKQFKIRPLITTFLMLSFIVTSLSLSLLNSIMYKEELKMKEANLGYEYKQTLDYVLFTQYNKKSLSDLDKNEYYKKNESILSTIVQIGRETCTICIAKVNYNYFDKLTILKTLVSKQNKNSVAVGNVLYKKLGSPKTIKIFNKNYTVSHILGEKNGHTDFDDCILLNYNNMTEEDKKSFTFFSDNMPKFLNIKNPDKERVKIEAAFKGWNKDFKIQIMNDDPKTTLKEAYERQSDSISNKILLIIIGICNILIISTFWVLDRRKELAIRKAFGDNKLIISKMIFKELLLLALVSAIIAIILQYLIVYIGGTYFDFNIKPSFINLIAVSLGAFIVSILSAVIPVRNALHIEISECLKG